MGRSTTVRSTERIYSEPCPVPMRMRLCAVPAPRPARLAEVEAGAAGQSPSAAGCLRGLGWGLALEGAAALLVYGIWHIALILR
jgi:hypothetical protein